MNTINRFIFSFLTATALYACGGCAEGLDSKIATALLSYNLNKDSTLKSIHVDNVIFNQADSTAYFKHLLKLLEQRSESFSKIAELKKNLAQDHMHDFLSENKSSEEAAAINKMNIDKSLDELIQNERLWNEVNDSMDLMLQAVHKTDTLAKIFYQVTYSLKTSTDTNSIVIVKNAILNRQNLRVVLAD